MYSVGTKDEFLCALRIIQQNFQSQPSRHHMNGWQWLLESVWRIIMHVSKGVISKHAAYTGQARVTCLKCVFRYAWHWGHIYVTIPYNIPLVSVEQVTFHLQPRKYLHTLTPVNATFTIILSAVTNIFILIDDYEVISCSSIYGPHQTSDFQQALQKVIICPDRYPLTNIKTRCSFFAATHMYF